MTKSARRSLGEDTPRPAARNPFRIYEEQCVADPARPRASSQYGQSAIAYTLAGSCDYSARSGAITVVPGTAIFANGGEPFEIDHQGSSGNRRFVVRYSEPFLQSIAQALEIDRTKFGLVGLPPGKDALKVFGYVLAAIAGGDDGEDAAISLAEIALGMDRSRRRALTVSGRDRRRVMSAVRYIESSFAEPCAIDALAAISGFSRYHFIRLFKTVTGQSPNQYVIEMRLRAAAMRLVESRAPVSAIALDVGFNDISYFGSRFRRVFGCTPRQIRRDFAADPQPCQRFRSGFERVTLPMGRVQ